MKIGIAGPVDLPLLLKLAGIDESPPDAYSFPLTSLLAVELLKRGHTVVVFGLSEKVDEVRSFDYGKLKIHLGRYRHKHRARDFFKSEREDLIFALQRERCDVHHAHWTYEFSLACLAVDRRTVITVHDWAPAILRQMPHPYRVARLLMALSVFRKGTHFTANSPYIQRHVEKWTGRACDLIPNGLPEAFFKWRQVASGQGETFVIIAITNGFSKRKNLPALLRAFSIIRQAIPNVELHLYGTGSEDEGGGHRWAIERELSEAVVFKGKVSYEEIQSALEKVALMIHPSLEESFGMVLIEAMAKGVPVIGGRSSGAVPWVLNNGDAGILVDVRNPGEIATAAIELIRDTRRLEEISRKGFEFARRCFVMPNVVDRYVKIYDRISKNEAGSK